MDRDFLGFLAVCAGVSMYAPVTLGVGSDNGSTFGFGFGVSSSCPSSEGEGDRDGALIEFLSDLLS